MHSLIYLAATVSLLFGPVDGVFMVRAFMRILLGSGISGYSMVGLLAMLKLILRKVHWPSCLSETLLMVPTWSGMKVVAELGMRTACLRMST